MHNSGTLNGDIADRATKSRHQQNSGARQKKEKNIRIEATITNKQMS
jgi:hypothetical protein